MQHVCWFRSSKQIRVGAQVDHSAELAIARAVEPVTGRSQWLRGSRQGRGLYGKLVCALRRSRWGFFLLSFLGDVLWTTLGPAPGANCGPYPHELARVTFAVAGDVIPHDAVRAAAAAGGDGIQGWQALFSDVSDIFQSADFGFVNLETPVAPAHSHGSKPFMFDAPVALPAALKASGIKIVSFANNHVMDQGWAGFAETREHLREIGLIFAGTGDTAQATFQPVFTEANGIKVVGWA